MKRPLTEIDLTISTINAVIESLQDSDDTKYAGKTPHIVNDLVKIRKRFENNIPLSKRQKSQMRHLIRVLTAPRHTTDVAANEANAELAATTENTGGTNEVINE